MDKETVASDLKVSMEKQAWCLGWAVRVSEQEGGVFSVVTRPG